MSPTYEDPDVSQDTIEEIRTELSDGPREPWELVQELVDSGIAEESARKGLRALTFDGQLRTTVSGEVELQENQPRR